MTSGTLKIHSENILPIIKQWLYSDKEIFLRELISNACDAMSKMQVLKERGLADYKDEELKVTLSVDKTAKTITISDGGIGMSHEEVEKYITQLAFSGAEEFIEKYKEKDEQDAIIGHFGLGFYSSFMVSKLVEIQTKSYQDVPAALWSCDGSSDYSLSEGTRTERGTDIILHVADDAEEFLDETRLKEILNKHCRFLPFKIHMGDSVINEKEPLWMKPASECTEEEYLDFYRYLYPAEPDPMFWIHLNVDYPFNLKGILYFPKITKHIDVNRPSVQLYCNRVLVSDNCKDIIPDYLTVLRGVIDSPDIPLNVSRSYLQMDSTVKKLASHISKKVSDKLKSIYSSDKETFLKKWPDIEMIVKLGVLQDEKFYDRIKELLVFETTKGEWSTVEEYIERHPESKIYYTSHGPDAKTPILDLYEKKEIEVLYAAQYLDTPLINFLESKLSGKKFQRIDGGLDDELLDKDREKTVLDTEGRTQGAVLEETFKKLLNKEKVKVEAKSLPSDSLPCFVMIKEEMRRMRDYFAMTGTDLPGMGMDEHTVVINTNNALVEKLPEIAKKDEKLAEDVTSQLYQMSLLSQKELDPKEMSGFVSKTTEVLEKFAALI